MKTRLTVLVSLFIISLGYTQTNPWKQTTNAKSLSILTTKKDLPTKNLYTLDLNGLRKVLANSKVGIKSSGNSNIIVQFPNAERKMESFRIVETPVLAPKLAAKYKDIRSYTGYAIDGDGMIKFSISHKGLSSMRFSGKKGNAFIEQLTNNDEYTVYKRSDKPALANKFECLVNENTANFSGKSSSTNAKNANDNTLRTFRLAVSTNGEYTQFHGGTKADAIAAINTSMTRVNGVFENDFAVTMVVIANTDAVIYTNANTDPYSSGSFNSQLQSTLTSVIGESNYDVGHLFAKAGNNGNAGCIGCVCVNGRKGSAFTSRADPIGDVFDIDYVAHELGHQFGGNHTFTHRNEGSGVQVEPGSGSTIMGYAGITGATDVQQNSDPYFHAATIQQITNYVKSTSCQTNTNTGNAAPTANAGSDYAIPQGTPFVLTGQGSDANSADVLTYCWEQMDGRVGTYPSTTATSGVAFRSNNPTTSNQRYFPRLETIKAGATSWQWEAVPSVTRALNFRLTVRDNKAGGAGNNSDNMRVNVTANAGPFVVNAPNTNVSWPAGSTQTVSWDVAGTTGNGINATNVDILLSTDGGNTYPIAIATAVANDGTHNITVPNTEGTQNRIMVKGSGNIFFDISNTNFEITGAGTIDTQAPSVPAGLIASNATQNTIDLSWSASTDNVGVSGYDIYNGNTVVATVATTTYQATGLTPDTAYSFSVKAKDAAGNVSGFSTIANATTLPGSTTGDGCTSGISSFPYNEGFENTLGAWTQSTNDDINWTLDSGGTPSRGTGPSSATQGTYYLYIEASGNGAGFPNKRAIVNSPCFDLSATTQAVFSFMYHMNGTSIGTLTLEASKDNGTTWAPVWSKSGSQGNTWQSATVDLATYTGASVQLRFNGVTSASWSGDITIDAISLTAGIVTPPSCTDVNLSITFDNYPEETSWQIANSSNEVVASGGTYGTRPDGSTLSVTECLEAGSYTFTINDTYGDGICCSFGNGSYSLTSGSTSLASGGSFGRTEATTFSIGGTSRGPEVVNFTTTEQIHIFTYPNPVGAKRIINIVAPGNDISYTIFDLQARKVSQGVVRNKSIDATGIQAGSYIISLTVAGKISNHSAIFR